MIEILRRRREFWASNTISRFGRSFASTQGCWLWTAAPIVIFISALILQILVAYPVHKTPQDADHVLAGICGINVLHGSRPLMFPGIDRFGALGCYVAAGEFSIFGVSRESLQLAPLLYFALFLIFVYLYLKEAFGLPAALGGLLLAAIPPVQFLADFREISMCCAGALWLGTVLERRRPGAGWFFLFGAMCGFALWCSILSLAITLPLVLWLLFKRVFYSPSKIAITIAATVTGSSPMWLFLACGGASKWAGDPHLHPTHTVTQILSNASYLAFTLTPWLFTNKQPDGRFLLSLSGLIMVVYAAAALVLLVFACWPDSKLRKQPVLLSQTALFGLILLCFTGMFVFSSAGSLRDGATRYLVPIYLIAPGLAAVICKTAKKTGLAVAGIGIGFLLIVNARDYPFWGTSERKSERAKLLVSEKLVQMLNRDRVQLVLGDYWDVYGLNFDSNEAVIGIPIQPGPDYFSFESALSSRKLKWALIDRTPAHLSEWRRRLGASGDVSALGDGHYLFVSDARPSVNTESLLLQARIADGPPPLTSFSQDITCSIHGFKERRGGTYILAINVKNTGSQSWYADGTANWVDASYRWFSDKGSMLAIEGNRAHLDRPRILPGESDALKLDVTAPPNPGSYTLWVSMVQEGVYWFFDRGAKPLVIKVTVY